MLQQNQLLFVYNLSLPLHTMVLHFLLQYNLLLHLTEHQHIAMFLFITQLGMLLHLMLFNLHKSCLLHNLLHPTHMPYLLYHIHRLIVLLQYMSSLYHLMLLHMSMYLFLTQQGM
jgi:hypothetical protein